MEILASLTGAIGLSKQLIELASLSKDAKAKMVVAKLQVQLAKLNTELANLINENRELKEELKKATSNISEVEFKNGLYYKPNDDGPFCTSCYDTNKSLVRVTEMAYSFRIFGKWKCNVCDASYVG